MRNWLNLFEGEHPWEKLVWQVRCAYEPNFQGNCVAAAIDLAELLEAHGIPCRIIEGSYDCPYDDGEVQCDFSSHAWVEIDGYILDPTVEQFDSDETIAPVGSDAWQRYDGTSLLSESAAETTSVFYHGSRKPLPVGTRLVARPDGYVTGRNMDRIEREAHHMCEAYLEKGRPDGAPQRSQCVYLVTDPNDIDYAGGYNDHVYVVEPEGQPWKANLHWYSRLYELCFDENISWEEASPLVNQYWNATSTANGEDLYEYLTTAAEITGEV
jgi:hypothetical protein